MSVPASEIKKIKETYAQAVQDPAIQFLALKALEHRNKIGTNTHNLFKNVASIGFFDDRAPETRPIISATANSKQSKTHPKGLHSERFAMLDALQQAADMHKRSGHTGHIPNIPAQISYNNPTSLENANDLKNLLNQQISEQNYNYLDNFPIIDAYSERDYCNNNVGNSTGCTQFLNDLFHRGNDKSRLYYSIGDTEGKKLKGQITDANKVAQWNLLTALAPEVKEEKNTQAHNKNKKKNESIYDYIPNNNNKANEPD